MTRRVKIGLDSDPFSEYDGPEAESELERDFDGSEIIRPTNTVYVTIPGGGMGEAVTSDAAEQAAKEKRRIEAAKKKAERAAEEAAAEAKANKKKKTVAKKSNNQ